MTTVVIATPVEPELVERIRAVDDQLDVLFEPELLPQARYPTDHIGDPNWTPTAELERLVARAEVLYGFPQEKPAQLAWAVRHAPALRFVQCMFAGAGQQVAAAELTAEELQRIAFAAFTPKLLQPPGLDHAVFFQQRNERSGK